MSDTSDLRDTIEAAIEQFDDGDGAPLGQVVEQVAIEYSIPKALDRVRELYVTGEIYRTDYTRVKVTPEPVRADGGEDGGVGDLRPFGGEVPHIDDTPDDTFTLDLTGRERVHGEPDPRSCHSEQLLGRDVEIDFGENVKRGEIVQVKDHSSEGRWISAKPHGEGGMVLADPDEHEIEFVEESDV